MAIDHAALDEISPLDPEELYRQWVLVPKEQNGPEGWKEYPLHEWRLFAHPDAHVCELVTADGNAVGWVMEPLAYLHEEGGIIPKEKLVLPVDHNSSASKYERALYGRDASGHSDGTGMTGTWTAFLSAGPEGTSFQRVYLGASNSIVYSPQNRIIATSHNLIPGIQRNEELSRAFDCLSRRAYFTFGLTAFKGLSRLLPNHYLDLKTFQPVRHWPIGSLDLYTDGKEGAADIVEHCRRLLSVISTVYPSFRVFLSAGRDSRAILAMLRPFIADGTDVLLSTTVSSSIASRTDHQAARRLARRTGLPHEVKWTNGSPEGGDDYVMRGFVRIGEAAASPSLFSSPGIHTRKPFDPDARFNLAGMGGETGRAFFWKKGFPDEDITPELLIKKVNAPVTNTVMKAAENWLNGLPQEFRSRKVDVLDLAYLEQRMGCWQAPMTYLFGGMVNPNRLSRLSTSPIAEILGYEIMLRLPQAYRAEATLQRDMVAYGWPELLNDIPFNEPTGILRMRMLLTKSAKNPRMLAGVFRRLWRS